MKQIPKNNTGPQWSSGLLNDLVFIKKHLRYPISKKTLPSAFVIALFLFGLSRLVLPLLFMHGRNAVAEWIFMCMIGGIIIFSFYRYLSLLKFASITTPYTADENRKLISTFLRSQQLATFSHPQAPEVFQIISTPIGNPKNDQREVMIFIADDKRILINSHFINQRFVLVPSSHNYRQMAQRLQQWISANNARGITII